MSSFNGAIMPHSQSQFIWSPDFFTQSLTFYAFGSSAQYVWTCILKEDVRLFSPTFVSHPFPHWERDGRTLDCYVVFDENRGLIMPLDVWQPLYPSVREQHVVNSPLCLPIYFYRSDSNDIGIPLVDAAEKRCRTLSHWFDSVDLGGKATTWIKILAKGYPEFGRQMQARDETAARCPLRMEKVAQHVGRIVRKWIAEASTQQMRTEDGDPRWRIGQGGITERDIILLGIINVSAGTWMPLFRLNRPLPPVVSSVQAANLEL
ncbi:hypothetical protein DENSPDRAFT_546342 [Dentipellis sp. KUC8613]|nr:hypothetical protein DENSPDRAFT_546342 [Dentipellis sp. KUC8613]